MEKKGKMRMPTSYCQIHGGGIALAICDKCHTNLMAEKKIYKDTLFDLCEIIININPDKADDAIDML